MGITLIRAVYSPNALQPATPMRAASPPAALQPAGEMPAEVGAPAPIASGGSPLTWAERAEALLAASDEAVDRFVQEWNAVYSSHFVQSALDRGWPLCRITEHVTGEALSDAYLFSAEPHKFEPVATADADILAAEDLSE